MTTRTHSWVRAAFIAMATAVVGLWGATAQAGQQFPPDLVLKKTYLLTDDTYIFYGPNGFGAPFAPAVINCPVVVRAHYASSSAWRRT
jgi:hypothetical protein